GDKAAVEPAAGNAPQPPLRKQQEEYGGEKPGEWHPLWGGQAALFIGYARGGYRVQPGGSRQDFLTHDGRSIRHICCGNCIGHAVVGARVLDHAGVTGNSRWINCTSCRISWSAVPAP